MRGIYDILQKADDIIWGIPMIVLILAVGIYMTFRLQGIQVRHLSLAIRNLVTREKTKEEGEVTAFAALCTALSATIGTGNIVGVATALTAGGPGALFWMVAAAAVGTATKYSECFLAVRYRKVAKDGHILGGPFYYIEQGMGKNWKWLAKLFAFFGAGAGLLGIGTFTQINGITGAVNNFFDPQNQQTVNLFGRDYSWSVIISGVILTTCAALVLIGGLQRISGVAQVLVPLMGATYVTATMLILVFHYREIPAAFTLIVQSAFGLKAAAGGTLGAMMAAMQKGVARGIFSNEAGLGSAPIAAAAVRTKEPAAQGLVSMLCTVIDTGIICTMTGLAIIVTGTWDMGLDGVAVTARAFEIGLPFEPEVSSFLLMACLVCFAFTTILGWNYYGEKCMEYLTGGRRQAVEAYRRVYIACVFIGPFMTVSAVWTIADIFNGLMAVPNLIAIVALSNIIATETRQYLRKQK